MGKIEDLEKRQAQIAAQIQAIKSRNKQKDRKEDARRKILLGSLTMEWMESDPAFKASVERALPSWLTRDIDRKLFGLEPLPASSKSAPAGEQTVVTARPTK